MPFTKPSATVMKAAFEEAGYLTPAERLRKVALVAVHASKTLDGRKDALYAHIRTDAELLWELFAEYRAKAVEELIADVAAELYAEQRSQDIGTGQSAPGHCRADNQSQYAQRASDATLGGRGQSGLDNQTAHAPLVQSSATVMPLKPTKAPRTVAGMNAVSAVARKSLLDTFMLGARPIGDATPTEALRWAALHERDAKFIRVLTAGLPPETPIRRHRRAEDTQQIYDAATKELCDAG